MEERVFLEDHGPNYPRGKRLRLATRQEWSQWFPGFEKYTKSVEELTEEAMPAKRGRPPKESRHA